MIPRTFCPFSRIKDTRMAEHMHTFKAKFEEINLVVTQWLVQNQAAINVIDRRVNIGNDDMFYVTIFFTLLAKS